MIACRVTGKSVARFRNADQFRNLVCVQANDLLVVQFGRWNFGRIIHVDHAFIEKILEHSAHSGKLARFCTFVAGKLLVIKAIMRKIA